jgi:hypothetical protein
MEIPQSPEQPLRRQVATLDSPFNGPTVSRPDHRQHQLEINREWRHPMYPNCQSCHEGCLIKHEASGYKFTLFCTNPRCHLFYEYNSAYFGPKAPMPTYNWHAALITVAALVVLYLFITALLKTFK